MFFGPIIGGVLLVLASVMLSELTKAWLLYLGLIFLFMVMYAPGGVASLILMNLRVAKFGFWGRIAKSTLRIALSGALALLGAAVLIEMVYHRQLNVTLGSEIVFLGLVLDVHRPGAWLGALAFTLAGIALFVVARRDYARRWSEVQSRIERIIKHREEL